MDFGGAARGEDLRGYAMELAQEEVEAEFGADHVADLDWEKCEVVYDDW